MVSMSVMDALAHMRDDVGRFDDQLFKAFEAVLGVSGKKAAAAA
jgi:hypothetical protein